MGEVRLIVKTYPESGGSTRYFGGGNQVGRRLFTAFYYISFRSETGMFFFAGFFVLFFASRCAKCLFFTLGSECVFAVVGRYVSQGVLLDLLSCASFF